MEFHINTSHATVNAALVQEALWQIDPASIAQLAADGHELRVNVEADVGGLVALLQGIDLPIDASDITQIPSICCGGCGG
ncbi:MAG: hypothetical protein WBP11_15200 [Dokdonella sp.]